MIFNHRERILSWVRIVRACVLSWVEILVDGTLSQYVGLTRLQLDEIGRERDLQRQGAQQAEARAERAVELAQERVVPAAHERL